MADACPFSLSYLVVMRTLIAYFAAVLRVFLASSHSLRAPSDTLTSAHCHID